MQSQQLLYLDEMDSRVPEPGAFVRPQEGGSIENETFFQTELCCSTLGNAEKPNVQPVTTIEATPALLFTPLEGVCASQQQQQQTQQWRKSKRGCEETSQPAGYTTNTIINTNTITTTNTTTTTTTTTNTVLAGKTGRCRSRQTISSSVAGGAAAVSDFCSDMGWGAPGDSPVSSVECNTEDDGEDFEDELSNAKKRASEGVRAQHLYSADLGSRFCHSSAMSRFTRACFASAASIFSAPQPLRSVGLRDNEEKEKEDEKKYRDIYSQASVPPLPPSSSSSSSSSLTVARRDGNTALNFTSNDVSIVRAFAMSLLEEEEKKKKKSRRNRKEELEREEEEGMDDCLSYM
ncbi:uncharacterized protein TM35_000271810 [Trypanosoma theileri]|uniref:Uncharacterized protein n=1 Tax=Trypanosoma theileri TaxID=67003 RepID=A0A1X0NPR9_9TRYP|nr:uncharacterized protein TM35_000271810 [Trypanosoma theileri]ORC86591.1 hypothetical protein TM35_000271810 [Trypanosoma theileri]